MQQVLVGMVSRELPTPVEAKVGEAAKLEVGGWVSATEDYKWAAEEAMHILHALHAHEFCRECSLGVTG